jgi:hypothetical protein
MAHGAQRQQINFCNPFELFNIHTEKTFSIISQVYLGLRQFRSEGISTIESIDSFPQNTAAVSFE